MLTPQPFEQLAVGQIGLLMAAEALLRSGFQVAVPMLDTGYDLLALKDSKTWRIQVKATSSGGANGGRVRARRGKNNRLSYTHAECDAIIAVHVVRGLMSCMTLKQLNGRVWMSFADRSCASVFEALE